MYLLSGTFLFKLSKLLAVRAATSSFCNLYGLSILPILLILSMLVVVSIFIVLSLLVVSSKFVVLSLLVVSSISVVLSIGTLILLLLSVELSILFKLLNPGLEMAFLEEDYCPQKANLWNQLNLKVEVNLNY